jgi:2-oxoglutarate dehydrogenase E1 component
MREPERIQWFREKIELNNRPQYSKEEKLRILRKLNEATGFEQFLQKKYVGQKRFSLEGGEALITGLLQYEPVNDECRIVIGGVEYPGKIIWVK